MLAVFGILSAAYLVSILVAKFAPGTLLLLFRAGDLVHIARFSRLARIFILSLFLIESIQWTFYYLLFRPLIERKLDIYDPAEYFILLPVVLVNQIMLLGLLLHKPLTYIVGVMFNISPLTEGLGLLSGGFTLVLAALGQGYIIIVISSLIRIIPAIPVRQRPNITVIGYGDVVRERILPALMAVYSHNQLAVACDYLEDAHKKELESQHVKDFSAGIPPGPPLKRSAATKRILDFVGGRSSFAIIAVPTPYHLEYVNFFYSRRIRFAVEKPFVFSEAELDLLDDRSTHDLCANGFVLSYYWLEKALPLNYLLSLTPQYAPLLNLIPDLDGPHVAELVASLGQLNCIAVDFVERDETKARYWSELKSTGGIVGETLIHPMTLVMHLADLSRPEHSAGIWRRPPKIRWFRNKERAELIKNDHSEVISATFLELCGELVNDVAVFIRCGKYIPRKRRTLIATYEHGYITCDLDEQVVRLFLKRTAPWPCLTVGSKEDLPSQQYKREKGRLNYQCQIELVNTFFEEGWGGLRFDDYPAQLQVIRELLKIARRLPAGKEAKACDVGPKEFAAAVTSHPLMRTDDQENVMLCPEKFVQPTSFILARAQDIPFA